MNKEWFEGLIEAYRTSMDTINKVNEIFSKGDTRYIDLEYEVIVAGFLDNNAISIEEKAVTMEPDEGKNIKGPQKELKSMAIKLLNENNFQVTDFERKFAGGIADIIAKNKEGETIIVECGPCNLRKAIDYLENPNTILWILHPDILYVVTRGKNWTSSIHFHNDFQRKQIEKHRKIINSLEFFDSKFRRKIPRTLSEEEIARMIKVSKNNKRDNMLIKFMYFFGLKNSEIQNLKVKDIHLDEKYITVKNRNIPIPQGLSEELEAWLDDKKDNLFPVRSSVTLSNRHIRRIVKKYAKLTNVRKYEEIHPHTLRHSYAAHLRENGASLRDIRRLLGHERLETTAIYSHVDIEKVFKTKYILK